MSKAEDTQSKGRSYAGMSAERRREQRRQQFLDAGLDVFGHQGYRAGTVRALCKAAGLTDRYFYESFSDTEALLIAVYEREMDKLLQAVVAILPGLDSDPDIRVQAALEAFFDCMREPRTARIALVEVLGVSPRVDQAYRANTGRFAELVMRMLHTQPQLQNHAPALLRALGTAFSGGCAMSAAQWLLEDYRTPQAVMVQACLMMARGVLSELQHSN